MEQDLNFILTKTPEDPFTLLVKAFYLKKINETNQATDILNSTSNLFSQIDLEKFDQFSPLLFIDGLTHYLLGNNFEAKKSLTKYLKKSPDSIEAKEILAEIAFNNNEPDNTIKLLSSIEAQYISLKSATLLMSAYVAQKDYLASTTLYKSIDKEIQENGRLLSLYVLSLISQGKATEAINLLEEQALLKPNSSDIQLMLGYHYLQYQFFDKALIVAKKLETQPNLSVAELNFIGVVYQSNNQTDIAQKYYLQALTIEPFDTLTTMNLVLVLFSKNDYVEANKITQNFLTQYSENISILKLHAESYIKLGNIKEAINSTKFIDEKTQNDLAIKYQLVDLYLKSNKADLALEKIEEIKKLEPLSSASLIAQAKAYLQKNDNEKAAKSLKIVFGLNLENTNRLIKIAQLQLEASDWEYVDKTITQLEKPKLNANYDDVILLKARLLFGKNQLDSAIKLLEQRKNKTADINQYLALFYSEANNTVKAIKHAQDAYLQIKDQATLQLLARLYWQNNQVSDTLNLLKEWLLVSPYDITTKRLYANLLAKNNNTDAAIEEYQDVLIHSPDDVVSLNNVAMLLLQNDKYNEALPLAEKAVKLAPLNATVNDTLGWLLVKSGKAEQGLTYLRESYARDSNNLSTRYHIAIALADTGKKSASITELNAILNLTSSFPERELAASKLKELTNN